MVTLPTLSQLYTGIVNDLETEYGVNISLTQKVALRVFAAVSAGKLWLLYKVLGFVQKNIWPDTADPESKGGTLERFGRIRLGRNPFPATAGQYVVTITGTSGATIPAQTTIFKSDDDSLSPGYLFVLDTSYLMPGTTGSITIRALTPGTDAKLQVGDTLTLVSPNPNLDNVATVTSEAVEPLAAETIEDYRANTLQSFRLEAQGGSPGDYRIWASDAQGVEKVYPYAKTGATNTAIVYVEATTADSTDGRGTPSASLLSDVEDVLNFNPDTSLSLNERGRRPMTVILEVAAVSPFNVDITITGGSFTTAQKAAILSAMTTQLAATRPFVPGADIAADANPTLDTNKINGVIYSTVPGAVYTGVTLYVNSVATLSYTFAQGYIPYLNSISYA